jgi:hypothetical protein
MKSLTPAGHDCQSASEIPDGGVVIAGNLWLRCNRDSSRRQGFSRGDVRYELSCPLNAYTHGKATHFERATLLGRSLVQFPQQLRPSLMLRSENWAP